MNYLSRLIVLLILSISFTAPASAAVVAMDVDGFCEVVAADDDKKPMAIRSRKVMMKKSPIVIKPAFQSF